jgi:alpha-beta hydrolase superfamily lysophospholipase
MANEKRPQGDKMVRVSAVRPVAITPPERLNWRAMQSLHTDDGVPLHVRHWSARGAVFGTVIVIHGLGEHLGRYQTLADDLNEAHWHVCAFDHRGHGASGGARGRIPRDDSLLRDLSRVIDQVREMREGAIVLLGHSMGGAVAARFVAQGMVQDADMPSWFRRVDGLMLSSPALDLGLALPQRALLAAMRALAPDTAVSNGLNPEFVSHDPDVVQAYRNDPLVHDRVTARLVRFLLDAGRVVREHAAVWSVPTLLMWADDDRLVAPRGSAAFAADAPAEFVTSQAYAGFFHEIFNEPGRDEPVATMMRWLGEQFR